MDWTTLGELERRTGLKIDPVPASQDEVRPAGIRRGLRLCDTEATFTLSLD